MPGRRRSKVFSIKEALKIRVVAAKRTSFSKRRKKEVGCPVDQRNTLYHTGKHWTWTIFNSTYVSFGLIKLPTTNKSTKHVYIRSPSPTRNENLPFIHSKSYFCTFFYTSHQPPPVDRQDPLMSPTAPARGTCSGKVFKRPSSEGWLRPRSWVGELLFFLMLFFPRETSGNVCKIPGIL